jgi:hypothetical protein
VKYHVSIRIKGTSTFEVEAEDKESAEAAAWSAVDAGEDGYVEWEYFEDRRTGDTVEVSAPYESSPSSSKAE